MTRTRIRQLSPAAAGVLDDVPLGEWPAHAAHWLAAGFDSEPLRQLAGLRSWKTGAALVLMPEALRSIGFCGDPMTPPLDGEVPVGLIYGVVWWWWCTRGGHAVAPVGQLTAKIAKTL